jgi:hypothetical protein
MEAATATRHPIIPAMAGKNQFSTGTVVGLFILTIILWGCLGRPGGFWGFFIILMIGIFLERIATGHTPPKLPPMPPTRVFDQDEPAHMHSPTEPVRMIACANAACRNQILSTAKFCPRCGMSTT